MKKIYVSYNFLNNEIIRAAMQNLAVDPTDDLFPSRIYWNTTDNRARIYTGTMWIYLSGSESVQSNTAALVVDQAIPGVTKLTINEATITEAGLLSSEKFALLTNATPTATGDTLVQRTAEGRLSAADPIANDEVVTKGYMSTALSSGMVIVGDIDCSTNPDYPVASAGDTYVVSADGLIGGASGISVTKGDIIICTSDSPSGTQAAVGTNFTIQERNLNKATTTTQGTVRLPTAAEVDDATSTELVPTLADVTTMVATKSKGYSVTIPIGTTTVAVEHNFGTHAIAQVYDAVTGGTAVMCDMVETSLNTLTLTFLPAITSTFLVNVTKGGT